mmetsp:Transcript_17537/g.52762  ORF Transcript_17537/g.52762 Transcript_17537/m.52762 type:complete len:1116 (+) Transcript_17537:61-3408(+)
MHSDALLSVALPRRTETHRFPYHDSGGLRPLKGRHEGTRIATRSVVVPTLVPLRAPRADGDRSAKVPSGLFSRHRAQHRRFLEGLLCHVTDAAVVVVQHPPHYPEERRKVQSVLLGRDFLGDVVLQLFPAGRRHLQADVLQGGDQVGPRQDRRPRELLQHAAERGVHAQFVRLLLLLGLAGRQHLLEDLVPVRSLRGSESGVVFGLRVLLHDLELMLAHKAADQVDEGPERDGGRLLVAARGRLLDVLHRDAGLDGRVPGDLQALEDPLPPVGRVHVQLRVREHPEERADRQLPLLVLAVVVEQLQLLVGLFLQATPLSHQVVHPLAALLQHVQEILPRQLLGVAVRLLQHVKHLLCGLVAELREGAAQVVHLHLAGLAPPPRPLGEGVPGRAELLLALQTHQAEELSFVHGAVLVVVHLRNPGVDILDGNTVAHEIEQVLHLEHGQLSVPLEVELLEDRDQLLQLPVHEAVPLVTGPDEGEEGVKVQGLVRVHVDGLHDLVRALLDHRVAHLAGQGWHVLRLQSVIALGVRLQLDPQLLHLDVPQAPGPDEEIVEAHSGSVIIAVRGRQDLHQRPQVVDGVHTLEVQEAARQLVDLGQGLHLPLADRAVGIPLQLQPGVPRFLELVLPAEALRAASRGDDLEDVLVRHLVVVQADVRRLEELLHHPACGVNAHLPEERHEPIHVPLSLLHPVVDSSLQPLALMLDDDLHARVEVVLVEVIERRHHLLRYLVAEGLRAELVAQVDQDIVELALAQVGLGVPGEALVGLAHPLNLTFLEGAPIDAHQRHFLLDRWRAVDVDLVRILRLLHLLLRRLRRRLLRLPIGSLRRVVGPAALHALLADGLQPPEELWREPRLHRGLTPRLALHRPHHLHVLHKSPLLVLHDDGEAVGAHDLLGYLGNRVELVRDAVASCVAARQASLHQHPLHAALGVVPAPSRRQTFLHHGRVLRPAATTPPLHRTRPTGRAVLALVGVAPAAAMLRRRGAGWLKTDSPGDAASPLLQRGQAQISGTRGDLPGGLNVAPRHSHVRRQGLRRSHVNDVVEGGLVFSPAEHGRRRHLVAVGLAAARTTCRRQVRLEHGHQAARPTRGGRPRRARGRHVDHLAPGPGEASANG